MIKDGGLTKIRTMTVLGIEAFQKQIGFHAKKDRR